MPSGGGGINYWVAVSWLSDLTAYTHPSDDISQLLDWSKPHRLSELPFPHQKSKDNLPYPSKVLTL